MEKRIDLKRFLKELKTSPFVLGAEMPMGYSGGIPIFRILNGYLCLSVPFLKYRSTGETDKTLVYPIRYVVTYRLPEMTAAGFEDLSLDPQFDGIDFTKPIGLFRHEEIRHLNKKEYEKKRNELISLYEELADALIYDFDFSAEQQKKMAELIQMLAEPSLRPIYKVIGKDFYNKYFNPHIRNM